MFFRVEERTTVICFKEFQLHAIAISLSDGCVRIFHVPHTQFFSSARGSSSGAQLQTGSLDRRSCES